MKTAIAVIDVQNDFMNADGNLYVPDAITIKSVIKEIIKFARERNTTLYFTQDNHDGSEPEFIKNGGIFPFHCMMNTEGQKNIDEAQPEEKEMIFHKKCYDVFDPTLGNQNITKWLKDEKIERVYLAGVATDYCVKAHALGLRKLGIETYVFTDGVKGVDSKTTENAIDEMKNAGVRFVRFVV
ncbi:MAG: cysteine hydrolase family protein [bacterium]